MVNPFQTKMVKDLRAHQRSIEHIPSLRPWNIFCGRGLMAQRCVCLAKQDSLLNVRFVTWFLLLQYLDFRVMQRLRHQNSARASPSPSWVETTSVGRSSSAAPATARRRGESPKRREKLLLGLEHLLVSLTDFGKRLGFLSEEDQTSGKFKASQST